MSATVGAALKKVAVYLLKDKKALKFVGGAILVILIVILMPIIALLGLFSGSIDIDTDHLHEMIAQQQSVIMSSWYDVESAMQEAGYDQQRIQEAQALVTFALYNHASQNGFADKLVGCFAPEQTDAQLVSAVNNTFGTNITAQDFTNVMASLRAAYIDYSDYTDPATKNNLDLVQCTTAKDLHRQLYHQEIQTEQRRTAHVLCGKQPPGNHRTRGLRPGTGRSLPA